MTAAKRLQSLAKALTQVDLARAAEVAWLAAAWAGIVLWHDNQALTEAAIAAVAGAITAAAMTRD